MEVLRVTVQDEVSLAEEDPVHGIGQLSCHLQHPLRVRMLCDAGDADPPSR
jgi:hypothetical protein